MVQSSATDGAACMKRYLSPTDAAFLRMESRRTPMHVGGLLVFKLPEDAPPDFLKELLQLMREQPFMPPPFDCRLSRTGLSRVLPAWEPAPVDMDYHIRHSALPYPGGERELGQLVERLHSQPLDLSRPVWECHLIEGLEASPERGEKSPRGRFAFYFKAHHCAIDGVGAMKLVRSWLSEDPADMSAPGMPAGALRDEVPKDAATEGLLRKALKGTRGNAQSVKELLKTFYKLGQGGKESVLRAATTTPRTLFNARITQQRRLGTQVLDLARFKAVGEATGATVNDVALAIVAGGVRRYLMELEAMPEASLTASIPIGLPRSDGKPGNAVTGFVCPLATDEPDPLKRLQVISSVTDRTKKQMLAMSSRALEQFALLGLSPLLLGQMTGVLARLPPFFNFVVSNVVASKKPLYLRGAELEAMYPMSFLFDGYAINVTIIGYAGRVAVGFIGCRDAIPKLQRLAVYTGEALAELEQALGQPARAPAKAARKRKPRRKASA
jgi:diacylglycerol O-acyltransferase / wax synthase